MSACGASSSSTPVSVPAEVRAIGETEETREAEEVVRAALADNAAALLDWVDPSRGLDLDFAYVFDHVYAVCDPEALNRAREWLAEDNITLQAPEAVTCSEDGTRCVDCAWPCDRANLYELHRTPEGLRLHGIVGDVRTAEERLLYETLPDHLDAFPENLGTFSEVGTKCALAAMLERADTLTLEDANGSAELEGEAAATEARSAAAALRRPSAYCAATYCWAPGDGESIGVYYSEPLRIEAVVRGESPCDACPPERP